MATPSRVRPPHHRETGPESAQGWASSTVNSLRPTLRPTLRPALRLPRSARGRIDGRSPVEADGSHKHRTYKEEDRECDDPRADAIQRRRRSGHGRRMASRLSQADRARRSSPSDNARQSGNRSAGSLAMPREMTASTATGIRRALMDRRWWVMEVGVDDCNVRVPPEWRRSGQASDRHGR